MLDLATATPDVFEPAVGTIFQVRTGEGELPIRLDEVIVSATAGSGFRQPFALYFSGPPAPVLAPLTHHLSHPELGVLELFLGPIQSSATDRAMYEAMFA